MSHSISEKIQRHFAHYDMRVVERKTHKGFNIYAGFGGPKYDYNETITKEDFPTGYYEGLWHITQTSAGDEKTMFGFTHYYDALDYIKKAETKQEFENRIVRELVDTAIQHVNDFVNVAYEQQKKDRIIHAS